jgi:hypothetical protein
VKNTLFLSIFLLFQTLIFSQNVNLENAHEAFKVGEYFKAKKFIDIVFKDTLQKKDPYATFVRARIFQKLYLDNMQYKDAKLYRAESLVSYIDCKNNNTDSIRSKIVDDQLSYLANTFYDESLTQLDTAHYYNALDLYDQFILASKTIDSTRDIKPLVLEFHTRLAKVFDILYENNSDRVDILALSKVSYMRILNEDEKNPKINYLMGKLFLEEAKKLQLKKEASPNDSLRIIEISSQGIAYMQTAYYFAPKNIDVINTLANLYTVLKDAQKASDYKLIADQVLKSGASVKF